MIQGVVHFLKVLVRIAVMVPPSAYLHNLEADQVEIHVHCKSSSGRMGIVGRVSSLHFY